MGETQQMVSRIIDLWSFGVYDVTDDGRKLRSIITFEQVRLERMDASQVGAH